VIRNDPPPPAPSAPPAPKKINVAVLLILAAVFITVPLLVFLAFMMWLEQTAFASVDELKPAELESVRVQMLNLVRGPQNRPDPPLSPDYPPDENTPNQRDPDIDPTNLIRPDFDVIFQPLLNAEKIEHDKWPSAAFLGEIRVRYKDGRLGTIRLYQAPDNPRVEDSPLRVYMRIGSSWYKACSLKELRTYAQACAERGTKAGR